MRTSIRTSTITLGRGERALWQARTADGRDIDEARRAVRAAARRLARLTGRTVEVYAPREAGGFMVDVIEGSS